MVKIAGHERQVFTACTKVYSVVPEASRGVRSGIHIQMHLVRKPAETFVTSIIGFGFATAPTWCPQPSAPKLNSQVQHRPSSLPTPNLPLNRYNTTYDTTTHTHCTLFLHFYSLSFFLYPYPLLRRQWTLIRPLAPPNPPSSAGSSASSSSAPAGASQHPLCGAQPSHTRRRRTPRSQTLGIVGRRRRRWGYGMRWWGC